MDYTASFYSRPSYDFRGGSFPVFSGSRRQRGGSAIGTLKSIFLPIAKDVGKAALATGIGFAQDVVRDKMMGKNLKQSIITHGKKRGLDLVKTAAKKAVQQGMLGKITSMFGQGRRRAGRRRRLKSKRRPISRKSTNSRKRRKRTKSVPKHKAKRRRIAANF